MNTDKIFYIAVKIVFLHLFFILGLVSFFLGFPIFSLSFMGIFLFLLRKFTKKWWNKKIKKRHKGNENIYSFKTFIIYGLTFSIGFWISTILIPFIKTDNLIVIYILTGLCLELSAKVCQMFVHKKPKIILDKWFIIWVLIHTFVIYGVLYIIRKVTILNKFLFFLAVGFIVAIIINIIWRIMYKK